MEAKEDRGAAEAWANGQVRALPFRAVWYVPLCLEQQAAFPYLTLGKVKMGIQSLERKRLECGRNWNRFR